MTRGNPPIVIDASVAITLVHAEATSALVAARIAAWRSAAVRLVVPAQFWLEITNTLLRRHRRPGLVVIAALHQLDELSLETIELERPGVLLALDLAERHALSTYDAAYLALAESLDGRLFTGDRALLRAAGPRGIAMADTGEHRLSEEPAPYGTVARPTWPAYKEASAYLARLRAEARAG